MSDIQIEMQPVNSSMISAVGYDPNTETMRVEFVKGTTYDLADVPAAEYEMLIQSASIGATYREFFSGNYRATKL